VKIVVLMKRVPDTASVFQINDAQDGVDTSRLKFVMSPYDEHAVQEAVDLKAANDGEVVVVTLGPAEDKEKLLTALAMGADRAVLVTGDDVGALGHRGIAEALAAVVREEAADIVFAGKQAVDDDGSQIPERVAELLGWSHASVITRFALDGTTANVDREIEGGQLTLEVPLPAIFSTEKGINTPAYPKLPNIMKAKKKPMDEKSLADLGITATDAAGKVAVTKMSLPRQERLAKILEGDSGAQVTELVRILKEDEKAL
jgi:electron transfer flavoprotein beta subunit